MSLDKRDSKSINGSPAVRRGSAIIVWFCDIIVFEVNPSLSNPVNSKTYTPESKLRIFINVSPLAP